MTPFTRNGHRRSRIKALLMLTLLLAAGPLWGQ